MITPLKATRYAPKLSLRGEIFVSTRQSICALAALSTLHVDRHRLRLRDDAVFSYLILLKNLLNLRVVENVLRAPKKNLTPKSLL